MESVTANKEFDLELNSGQTISKNVYLLRDSTAIGAVNTIDDYLEYSKEATHVGVTMEYGAQNTLISIYSIHCVSAIHLRRAKVST